MNTREETDDLFGGGGGGGAPSCKLQQPGDEALGVIYKLQKLVEKDDDDEIIYYPNSDKPKPLFVAHLITAYRNDEVEGDDGSRRVWLKGNGLWALQQYVKAEGIKPPAVGDTLWVAVTSLKPNPDRKKKAIKQHEAKLRKGTEDDVFRALGWAKKKEDEYLARTGGVRQDDGDDAFWGGAPSSTPTSGGGSGGTGRKGNSTLESMRASRNSNVEAPF